MSTISYSIYLAIFLMCVWEANYSRQLNQQLLMKWQFHNYVTVTQVCSMFQNAEVAANAGSMSGKFWLFCE